MLDNLNRENKKEQVSDSIPLGAPVIPPKNSFINGDCMEYLKLFPPNFFDLAIVDPPYGIDWKHSDIFKKAKAYDNTEWDIKPADEYWDELKRVSKNWIVWGINYFSKYFETFTPIIWDKKNGNSLYSDGEIAGTSIGKATRIFRHAYIGRYNPDPIRIHPTQKPTILYKWLLRNYAKAGDLILDTHVGSASSLIACTELGFDYVGFEIDKEYYTMAKSRLGRATRKYELFEAV